MILHIMCVQIFFKNQPTDPPMFWGQKGKQTFYFLGLMTSNIP